MRKLSIAVLALAAIAAIAAVAYAANVNTVTGSTTVRGKGSGARPIPTGVKFGFQVTETDPGKRATVVARFTLGAEGLRANPKFFPKCAYTDMDAEPTVPAKCNKALVGSGIAKNATGPNTDQSLSFSRPCNLRVRLYNNGSGMIIRLDGEPPLPPSFDSNQIGCLLPIHEAINGRFVKRRIGGVTSSDFTFNVTEHLKHPLFGTDNSIRLADTNVSLKVKRVRGKRRGFYEKIGCKGRTRLIRGTFTTEQTATQAPQTSTDTHTAKC
jgi:hypothetical protein